LFFGKSILQKLVKAIVEPSTVQLFKEGLITIANDEKFKPKEW
jgi:hypothetical protein